MAHPLTHCCGPRYLLVAWTKFNLVCVCWGLGWGGNCPLTRVGLERRDRTAVDTSPLLQAVHCILLVLHSAFTLLLIAHKLPSQRFRIYIFLFFVSLPFFLRKIGLASVTCFCLNSKPWTSSWQVSDSSNHILFPSDSFSNLLATVGCQFLHCLKIFENYLMKSAVFV